MDTENAHAAAAANTIVKEDLFAPFESRPDIAAHFIDHVLRTNPDNATLTANLNAVCVRARRSVW